MDAHRPLGFTNASGAAGDRNPLGSGRIRSGGRVIFVGRHPGAVEWVQRWGLRVNAHVEHLDITTIQAGDTVIGSLPVDKVAAVCRVGGEYYHLCIDIPSHLRGQELSADQLDACGATLRPFHVLALDTTG